MVFIHYGNYRFFGDCPQKLMVIFLIYFSPWIFMVFLSYKVLFDNLSHQIPRTTCTSPISFLPSLSFVPHPPPTAFLFFLRILSHGGEYLLITCPCLFLIRLIFYLWFSTVFCLSLKQVGLLCSQSRFADKVKKHSEVLGLFPSLVLPLLLYFGKTDFLGFWVFDLSVMAQILLGHQINSEETHQYFPSPDVSCSYKRKTMCMSSFSHIVSWIHLTIPFFKLIFF